MDDKEHKEHKELILLYQQLECLTSSLQSNIDYMCLQKNKRLIDDDGNQKSMKEQTIELKQQLVELNKQNEALRQLVEKLMVDLKKHEQVEEGLEKQLDELTKKLDDRRQLESSSTADSKSPGHQDW